MHSVLHHSYYGPVLLSLGHPDGRSINLAKLEKHVFYRPITSGGSRVSSEPPFQSEPPSARKGKKI